MFDAENSHRSSHMKAKSMEHDLDFVNAPVGSEGKLLVGVPLSLHLDQLCRPGDR